MRRISISLAGAICACAAALAAPVSHAQPVPGAAKIIRPIKVVKSDQASILKRGLLLRLRHSRKYSLKVTSATCVRLGTHPNSSSLSWISSWARPPSAVSSR